MCGRYLLLSRGRELADHFGLADEPAAEPRFNIAPFQTAPVVRLADRGRRAAVLRWGLVASWAKDEKAAAHAINARCETAAEKPTFRAAFQKRRCLVPATGFYEWTATGRQKLPVVLRPPGPLFAFAGLW